MSSSRKNTSARRQLSLSLESLEDRRMMAVTPSLAALATSPKYVPVAPAMIVPALSSLPGAAKTIFLDFDGDFQPVWHRTDSGQTYEDVNARPSNLSAADIRKVWETVAEDYAPFNVNVTTVQPASFANNVAVRVVIAGEMSASLVTGPQSTVTLFGDRFITNDNGATLLDTSGYSAIGSFTNGEPNVVYVFGKYLSTWGTTSPEGHPRSLAALVANTTSHEAGHSFGLAHHTGVDASGAASDYHVGGPLTTPIMGDNTAGDRTLWSAYNSYGSSYDAIGRLTTVLGGRTDDHPSGTWFAEPLAFSSMGLFTTRSIVSGVIEKTSDQDWFKFSTGGAAVSFDLKTVEFANLDAKLEVYKMVPTPFGRAASLIAAVDGPTLFGAPFSGLGASYSANLGAGDYMVAVKSHGGYSDLGNYTLTVSQNTLRVVTGGVGTYGGVAAAQAYTAPTSVTGVGAGSNKFAGGLGQGEYVGERSLAVDAVYSAWQAPEGGGRLAFRPTSRTAELSEARLWENLDALMPASIRAGQIAADALVA